MRYTIDIIEQPPQTDTPPGLSAFVVNVISEERPDEAGEMTMIAPSNLTQLHPSPDDYLRLASFVALTASTVNPKPTLKSDNAWEHIVMLGALALRNTNHVAIMRLHTLDAPTPREFLWPQTHKLRELSELARADLKRTALEQFIQPSQAPEKHNAKQPKF